MTRIKERLNPYEDFIFIREAGKVWHVKQRTGDRAECSVGFDASLNKKVHTTRITFGLGKCCTRRGCKEAFQYIDSLEWRGPQPSV